MLIEAVERIGVVKWMCWSMILKATRLNERIGMEKRTKKKGWGSPPIRDRQGN